MISESLGSYRILGKLGEGGMGEVYRARDTTLGRDVAVKILPRHFTSDPEHLARFEREARLLAALNHPNIGAIYGLERSGDVPALILELVEGPTLADLVRRGPTSVPEVVRIARQIVDALDAAHEKGIVHRDLKPANIKITPNGAVKVLDFGLAKAADGDGPARDLSVSPTMAIGGTREGLILGTPSYMSPQQARGQAVDKRADIWALGCVLYEMLTGRPAFGGDTLSDVIARVLTAEPDWSWLPASAPPALRRLLSRCLEKDPRARLRDVGDARVELEEPPGASAADRVSAPAPRHVQFHRLTDFAGMNDSPALSPDSKMVAFVAPSGSRRQIWIRLLAGGAPLQITRDDLDHEAPRWTPDSSALVYYTPSPRPEEQGTLWEVSALGGVPRPITAALAGGDVSHDGRRVAVFQFRDGRSELVTIARDGSDAKVVAHGVAGRTWTCPRWSPDDRWLAFAEDVDGLLSGRAYVVAAAGGDLREVLSTSSLRGVSWLPDGTGLVYSSGAGSTVAYPPTFNLRVVGADGSGDRPLTFGDMSHVAPDAHPSGRLLACRIRSQSDIWRFPVSASAADNTRDAVRITRQTGQVQTPSVSPDGRRIVYLSDNGGHGNLWVAESDGTNARQLTFERTADVTVGVPLWSPLGDEIAFILGKQGSAGPGLWTIRPDGRGLRQLVDHGRAACWSPDGRWLYYAPMSEDSNWGTEQIFKISAAGGAPIPVRSDGFCPIAGKSTFYFASRRLPELGGWDWEMRRAAAENGPSAVVAQICGTRLVLSPMFVAAALSPDERWIALPLTDGGTTNLWAIPTEGGPMRPLTDFGDRPTIIARNVSWAPDAQSLYAAVAETESDVIMLEGLL